MYWIYMALKVVTASIHYDGGMEGEGGMKEEMKIMIETRTVFLPHIHKRRKER